MSSINGINSTISGSIMSQGMRSRPDPAEKFQSLDVDGSGGLDKTELSELAKELSKMTGKTLDIDSSITTYDANGDGVLSQDETDKMMRDTLGPPPPPPDKAGGTNTQRASNAYLANSGDDKLNTLQQLLEQLDKELSTKTGTASST